LCEVLCSWRECVSVLSSAKIGGLSCRLSYHQVLCLFCLDWCELSFNSGYLAGGGSDCLHEVAFSVALSCVTADGCISYARGLFSPAEGECSFHVGPSMYVELSAMNEWDGREVCLAWRESVNQFVYSVARTVGGLCGTAPPDRPAYPGCECRGTYGGNGGDGSVFERVDGATALGRWLPTTPRPVCFGMSVG
jgi:hypothetical protein